jgi:hypothetical protein
VPVALSATHVAYSSVRVEPTWMAIGQSAGVAAALAAKEGVTVQALDYGRLRARLLAQNQVLDLPVLPPVGKVARSSGPISIDLKSLPGLILDDSQAELSGDWERSTNFKPHVGTGYLHDEQRSDGKSRAVFRFKAPADGEFELRMAYSAHETRTTRLPVTIVGGGSEHRFGGPDPADARRPSLPPNRLPTPPSGPGVYPHRDESGHQRLRNRRRLPVAPGRRFGKVSPP